MKLLKLPTYKTDLIKIDYTGLSHFENVAGRASITDAEIVVPDYLLSDDLEDTFRTLKYGPLPGLADAMREHRKIDKIEFQKDNIILHGVIPFKMERSATFDGRVFTCKIDHFEEIK